MTVTKHRKPLVIAILTLIAWLVISGVAGPLFGNLSSVQKNDNADFLPKHVEAQKFADVYKDFTVTANRQLPALVLFTGDVTPEKVASVNQFLNSIGSKPLVTRAGKSIDGVTQNIGDYLTPGQQIVAFPSQDMKAILANVPFEDRKSTRLNSSH